MKHFATIFFVVIGLIIVGCLLFGCSYKMEGLEMRVPLSQSDCEALNEEQCSTSANCTWNKGEGGLEGKCTFNKIDLEQNVPQDGPDVLPSQNVEGYCSYC
jgi:hypothetical protein